MPPFGWSVRNLGTPEAVASRALLTRLIDSAFANGNGLQAWVAHWGWVPLFSTGDDNDYTPYEEACGLDRAGETTLANADLCHAVGVRKRCADWDVRSGLDRNCCVDSAQRTGKDGQVTEIGPSAIRLEGAEQDFTPP